MTLRTPLALVTMPIAACVLAGADAGAVDPGSQLIPCDQGDTRVTIDTSSHLDPGCTWTRGFEIDPRSADGGAGTVRVGDTRRIGFGVLHRRADRPLQVRRPQLALAAGT